MAAKRTTVTLGGDLLERTETERARLSKAATVDLSLNQVALVLIHEALDARDAARKKGAKS
jgi:hypothetical protein